MPFCWNGEDLGANVVLNGEQDLAKHGNPFPSFSRNFSKGGKTLTSF